MTGKGKTKHINIDQYYCFKYNQNYRLENMSYYRNYSLDYNFKNRQQISENNSIYVKNKRILNDKTPGSIIEFIDGPIRILFN
tara:strand:- start:7527 stop:7775 length:249 start_codon:yes stop_codon:yes gene_type:complete